MFAQVQPRPPKQQTAAELMASTEPSASDATLTTQSAYSYGAEMDAGKVSARNTTTALESVFGYQLPPSPVEVPHAAVPQVEGGLQVRGDRRSVSDVSEATAYLPACLPPTDRPTDRVAPGFAYVGGWLAGWVMGC